MLSVCYLSIVSLLPVYCKSVVSLLPVYCKSVVCLLEVYCRSIVSEAIKIKIRSNFGHCPNREGGWLGMNPVCYLSIVSLISVCCLSIVSMLSVCYLSIVSMLSVRCLSIVYYLFVVSLFFSVVPIWCPYRGVSLSLPVLPPCTVH